MLRRNALCLIASNAYWESAKAEKHQKSSSNAVYLTFDTGHMGIAPLVAQVLQRQQVQVTFFAAHERTQEGDGCLGEYWAPWWRERAKEGHAFGSHTWQHAVWRGDLPAAGGEARFRIQPTAGPDAGQRLVWTASQYCADIRHAAVRLAEVTGVPTLPLYRAPGGKTSAALLATAERCGWKQVGSGLVTVVLEGDVAAVKAAAGLAAGAAPARFGSAGRVPSVPCGRPAPGGGGGAWPAAIWASSADRRLSSEAARSWAAETPRRA